MRHETNASPHDQEFHERLRGIVGSRNVLTSSSKTRRFTSGFRYGGGKAECVVLPGKLLELWQILEACVAGGRVVICQAANTGLTGGSTPFGNDYDREVVVISMMRIKSLHLLGGGRQVLAFPGTTLDELERALEPIGREPHSVIGSSCLGASVIGGVCNNSGGSLIRRGPAFTELALYARIRDDGTLELVNHLEIDIGDSPAEILSALDRKSYRDDRVHWSSGKQASDGEYADHVRDVEAHTPARFNADSRRLFEASGSAGKLIVFAVRLDTFEAEKTTKVFYVGTNDPDELTSLRRDMLSSTMPLPIAAEYMHRDAFDIAEEYGKDTYLLIRKLGTRRLPRLFALKSRIDAFAGSLRFLPANLMDKVLQFVSRMMPSHLPHRLRDYRDRFEHHLMLKVGGDAIGPVRDFLLERFPTSAGEMMECSGEEGAAAFLHRFAAAGAAVRYRMVNEATTGEIVALDIALPRNAITWRETLPPGLEARMLRKLYYGHFFCYVFHQDYIIRKDVDWLETEHEILQLMDAREARYPAEHNVGHLYRADEAVAGHYRSLDPCNCLNPGIGQTSKRLRWK